MLSLTPIYQKHRHMYKYIVLVIGATLALLFSHTGTASAQQNEYTSQLKIIESPLLDESVSGGYALVSSQAYKPSHHLYPVLIERINEFAIKPLLHGYQYKLLPGRYVIELKPNFSDLSDIKVFMNSPFTTKRIEIRVEGNKEYAIGARINPQQPDQWQVQFYDIKQVITEETQP